MRELLIKRCTDEKLFFLVEDGKLVEFYKENKQNEILEGNIYIGKVQNVLTGLDAAFINLGEDKNAFIHKKDILPKKDEKSINNKLSDTMFQHSDEIINLDKSVYENKYDKKNSKLLNEKVSIIEDKILDKFNLDDTVSINKLIRPGVPILVEVKKDKMKTKGARVSTHLSLRGRFVVFLPNANYITVSSKITESNKREKLINLVKQKIPENTGAIIRTNASNATESQIDQDIKELIERWEKIKNTKIDSYPVKIYDAGGVLNKLLVDLVDYNLDNIVVEDDEEKILVQNVLKNINSNTQIIIKSDVISLYNISKELEKIDNNKIWLKSGGFITIDYTEALTAIDVNTGKFIRKK